MVKLLITIILLNLVLYSIAEPDTHDILENIEGYKETRENMTQTFSSCISDMNDVENKYEDCLNQSKEMDKEIQELQSQFSDQSSQILKDMEVLENLREKNSKDRKEMISLNEEKGRLDVEKSRLEEEEATLRSSLVVSKGLKRKGEEKERGLREERNDCLKGVNSKNWCTGIKAPKGFRGDSMFMSIRVLVGKVISYVWI